MVGGKHTGTVFLTLLCAAVLLCFFLGQPLSHAEGELEIINVTGNIDTDTTWEGGKIYRISGWRALNEGARLTVEPGAVIKLVNNGRLSIYGELLAVGTPDNFIYFTVGNDTSSPQVGQAVSGEALWSGLSVAGNGKAVLEYAEIRHAREWGIQVQSGTSCLEVDHCTFLSNKRGITVENGTARIEHSVFEDNEEGVRFALSGGSAFIKNNLFRLGASAADKTGINITSPALLQPIKILGNTFSGTEQTDTVGIYIHPAQDPENSLLDIMFNTFRDLGVAVQIEGGGHRLRGNNFSSSKLYAVQFSPGGPVPEALKADLRYNYWDSIDGPRRLEGYKFVGSGDYIYPTDCLIFTPWGTKSYQPCYEPLEVSIIQPQEGACFLEGVPLQASARDANLRELIFYLDGEEIYRVGEDEIISGEVYGCEWRPAEGEPLKDSYLFCVKALNQLGQEKESSLTFNYLPAAPPRPAVNILTPPEGSHINGDTWIKIEAAAANELGEEGLSCLFLEVEGIRMAEAGLPHTSINWLWETAGYDEGIITIRAVAADVLGQESSDQVSILLDRTPPGPVSLHEPFQGQSGVRLPVKFSWETAESLSPPRYRLQLAAAESGLGEEGVFNAPLLDIEDLPDNCYTLWDLPLQSGKRYLWRVQASDLAGNQGPWSEAREFRTYIPSGSGVSPGKGDGSGVVPSYQHENLNTTGQAAPKMDEETPGPETATEDMADMAGVKVFADLEPGHPAAEAILFLYNRGIVKGMGEGIFAPTLPLSRAQAVALLIKFPLETDRKGPPSPGTFEDLESGAWYTPAVKAAAGIGLLSGYEDNSFRPASPINGAEFAALLCRLENFVIKSLEVPANTGEALKEAELASGLREAVLNKTPPWAANSVAALIKRGIIGEKELAWFEPRQPLSRAEAAILLWKAYLYYQIDAS